MLEIKNCIQRCFLTYQCVNFKTGGLSIWQNVGEIHCLLPRLFDFQFTDVVLGTKMSITIVFLGRETKML